MDEKKKQAQYRWKRNHQSQLKEWRRKWYLKNNGRVAKLKKAYRAIVITIVNTAKQRPCADCGNQYPPYVMDFDHRDQSTKSFCIGQNKSRGALSVSNEIAKCDVVCSNCHRERTHHQELARYGK